jgi:[ribosomal protein S18]-alanine N-acetyltransferase
MTPSTPARWLTVRIEPMAEADLQRVLDIEYLSFASPWPRDIFLGELRDSDLAHLFVARIGEGVQQGCIAGYSCTWVVADEMHITSFAVHPNFRRQHVGHQLLEGVLTRAVELGCRQAVLEVRVSNRDAQRLYGRFGFAPVSVRKRYYVDNHEDAIVMFLDDIAAQLQRHDSRDDANDRGS